MTQTLEERVQRLEDLVAIQRLFHDYRRFLDGKEFESYSHLFAKDGQFGGAAGSGKGPAAIRELVTGMLGTFLRETRGDDFHIVANEVVDLDGDRATAEVTWAYVVRGADDAPQLLKLGHYNDELIREDGRWKFWRRSGATDLSA